MGKAAPNSPPFRYDADQQAKTSQGNTEAQTQANRPDQSNPFASSQWTQDDMGRWHQSSGFTGPTKDVANNLQGQMASSFATPMDNGTAARDQAISATYDQMASRLNPQMALQGEQIQTQLANQGLSPGSAAYRQAESQFGRDKNDAYQNAMNNAVQQGLGAQNLTFNQNMQARNMPLQELQALSGFLGQQNFQGATKADTTQYLPADIAWGQYNLGASDMENKSEGGMASGLGSMLGSMFMFL